MSILVVGSFIVDCVAETKRAPIAGETIVGKTYNTYFGGKGANQAVCACRQGAKVYMAGMLGDDTLGKSFYEEMKSYGVNVDNVLFTKDSSTGVGCITLEENGQNRIVIIPGANYEYKEQNLLAIEDLIKNVDIIVSQLELKYEVVRLLARICKKYNKTFILNPAPAVVLDREILESVTYLTPNETELGILTNQTLNSKEDYINAARTLCDFGVKGVIVTLGDKGALYVTKDYEQLIPSYKVKAIDTTGAGDSFTGALAAYLSFGKSLEESLYLANVVGALTVQKKGAIPSLPTAQDVKNLLKSR